MKKTILVIEDNPEMSENIAGILELANYNVVTAPNGRAGIDVAFQLKPDLILCDIMMPELDGYGVLHILNNDASTKDIPLIFLTAKSDRLDIRRGMSLGADDYITKPFDGLELLHAVEIRLKKKSDIIEAYKTDQPNLKSPQHTTDDNHLNILTASKRIRHYKRKEIVFLEGQHAGEMFSVNSGKIKTFKTNGSGKELITGLHYAGSYIGITPLFNNTVNNESAVALEDSEIYIISKEELFSTLLNHGDMAFRFIQILSQALIEAQRRLVEIAYHTVRQRVASTLLNIYEQYQQHEISSLIISESRRDLSCIIGTAIESLNRTLADFKDEGMIDISDSGISLTDKKRLEKVGASAI